MDNIEKIALLLNNSNPDNQLEEGKRLSKKFLVNTLNYINFQDGTILINFRHQKYGNIISLQAKPQPYLENTLDCLWAQKDRPSLQLSSYRFLNFLINNGRKMILVTADVREMSEEGISLNLPETCYEVSLRQVRRYSCAGIHIELLQNGILLHGTLLDFNPVSFGMEISAVPPQTFQLINPEATAHLIFRNGRDILYSGECRMIRQTLGQRTRNMVLEPVHDKLCRFKHKEYRSKRHKLSPSPTVIFRHPLTQKMITLEIDDLSGAGFSVEEYYMNSVLLPGMIIPELFIEIAHDFKIQCRAQVVYRNIHQTYENETYAKCGIVILDMDIQEQVRLSSLLHHITNRKSYICNVVDLDALWKLFFEAGFVYPKKYAFIHANKEKFKETYEKLYVQCPTIARHFIYQEKGLIQGHISMLRLYENTWLIHHHAASRSHCSRAGLVVLDQLGRFANDYRCLFSAHMSFFICYFRPENAFPNRIFGGFTRELNNRQGSSLDLVAYFHLNKTQQQQDMPRSWTLEKTQREDLLELIGFYEHQSGGLMTYALDLNPDVIGSDELNKEYERFGFKKERHLFSLKNGNNLAAVLMVNVTDVGLNLSNLTNCIHIFILDWNNVTQNILHSTLFQLLHYFECDEIPILLYPVKYCEIQGIPYEKIYNLWVMDTQYGDQYLKFMENLFTHSKHE